MKILPLNLWLDWIYKMEMDSFKIHDFRVFQRDNGIYYIELIRDQRRSLKTKDPFIAKKRATLAVEQYFQRKIISIKKGNSKTISEYLEEFLEEKAFRARGSERGYITAVNMFVEFIGDKNLNLVTTSDIERFKNLHQQKRKDKIKGKLSEITLNTYIIRLKAMFDKARADGFINSVPKFKKYKIAKRLPVILRKDDKTRLLEYIKEKDFKFYRVCRFALFTGCRRSEIISARWEKFAGFTIRVIGKGDQERTIPLVPQAKEAMGEVQKKGPVFWQAHPDTYSHYFKKYARACGISNTSFHKMRHTAATEMLEAGISISVIQSVLGHSDVSTTRIYAHVMEKFMIEEMGKFGL